MKRIICLLLIAVLLLAGCSNKTKQTADAQAFVFNEEAYSEVNTCGETAVKWGFSYETGELAIGGEGAMPDYSANMEAAPWAGYSYTSVRICEGVTHIGTEAFASNTTLTKVEMASSVTSIGANAFYACEALTSVSIPASVTEIGKNAFSLCTALNEINVNEENTAYKSVGGVLFTKDGKTLVQYPVGRTDASYVVPDGVEVIGELAFGFCGDTLAALELPGSLTNIEKAAFIGCRVLESVVYRGTEQEWKGVKLASENDLLTFAEFVFS